LLEIEHLIHLVPRSTQAFQGYCDSIFSRLGDKGHKADQWCKMTSPGTG